MTVGGGADAKEREEREKEGREREREKEGEVTQESGEPQTDLRPAHLTFTFRSTASAPSARGQPLTADRRVRGAFPQYRQPPTGTECGEREPSPSPVGSVPHNHRHH